MSEWVETTLSDIIDIIGGGTPKTSNSEYWNGDIPWLSVVDFNNGRKFVETTEKSITEKGLAISSTKLLNKGDIIISARGTVGAMAILKKQMAFNQSCYGIKPIQKIADTNFVYYLLKESILKLVQISHGGVFNTITRESFQAIQVLLPPLPEQKAIAGVLSSLDDKIDLLHRQNKTLEAMAETLFRQWFIEGAEDDWGVVELQNYGEIICGKTPSKKILEYFGNEIPFIKIPDMHQQVFILSTSDELSLKGAQSQAKKTLPEGAICISCIATVGLVSLTSKPSQTNQQINSIIPKECYYRYFLYLLMKSSYDILHSMASGGTATLNLNTGDFSRMKVILPPHARIIEFHNLVTPMFRKILKNQTQIQLLAEQRNTIIPKLMSGEVRVELE